MLGEKELLSEHSYAMDSPEDRSDSSDAKFYFVYLLRSISDPSRVYVGLSTDLETRLAEHNAGKAKHTSKYRPWRIETYLAFTEPGRGRAVMAW